MDLAHHPPSKTDWKKFAFVQLHSLFRDYFMQRAASAQSLSELNCFLFCPSFPASLIHLWGSPINNFRIRLILFCSALVCHTEPFHARPGHVREVSCPLCRGDIENPFHFVCHCPRLDFVRARHDWTMCLTDLSLFESALGSIHLKYRLTFARFLTDLRNTRTGLLYLL